MPSFVRAATPSDLGALADIELAADQIFADLFGSLNWAGAPAGMTRAAEAGFVLVVSDEKDGAPVGFAHVLEVDGQSHLEQLSVLPTHGRLGHGRALLDAALDEAAVRGATTMTLRTYADVPWNAPFYRAAGFTEQPIPTDDFQAALTQAESDLGLERHGRRVHMAADLRLRSGGMEMDATAFEQLVIDELDQLPDEMVEGLENVVFVVEDHPEDGEDLFGLYDGLAVTERGQYGMGELPDRIVVYRRAHLAACANESQLRDEVHTTLVHEIAHYYGIDDAQLHEMGWA